MILITIDSLRSDHIGHLSDIHDLTPEIDSLAERGISCTHAYANGIPTYFAFRSILGGRRDLIKENPIGLPSEWQTLADEFSNRGYDTAGFNAANPWLTSNFNYNSGFDTFVDFIEDGSEADKTNTLVNMMQKIQHKIPDDGNLRDYLGYAARIYCSFTNNFPIKSCEVVTERAIEWLNARTESDPFFLWVHYMDPHYPWTPNSEDVSNWEVARTWHEVAHIYNMSNCSPDDSTLESVQRLYADEVSNTDSAIGKLVQQVNEDETIICVTSDHGTELGDHGGFSHGPDSLYEEIIRIPLVVAGPSISSQTISTPVQHIDIPTTLVELANPMTEVDMGYEWSGINFLKEDRAAAFVNVFYDYNPATQEPAESEQLSAAIDWPMKLHWNHDQDNIEYYDLLNDPNESYDMSGKSYNEIHQMKKRILDEQKKIGIESRTASTIVRLRKQLNKIEF